MNKITIGTIAVILSFLLVIQISPVTVIGENESEPSSNESPASLYTAPVHDTEESASIEIIRELENGREENVKRFEMSNGTVMAAQYESPVHYLDNGQWMDIDNTLSDIPGGEQDDEDGYQSTKNTIQVKFAKKHDAKKLVKMNLGDYQLSWSFVGAEKSKNTKYTVKNPEKTNDDSDITVLKNITSGVIYEDILEHVDLEYYIRSTTVKENIIIKNKLDSYCFQMILRPKKLTPVLRENAVFFENENGESVFQIPAPFMFDAAGAESSNVKLELTPDSKEKEYVLTVTADPEWINDENRIFTERIPHEHLTVAPAGAQPDGRKIEFRQSGHGIRSVCSVR